MRKYLVLGSALYVKDWYAANGAKYLADGYLLCAINNAWAVDPQNLTQWYHSTDYFEFSRATTPPNALRDKWIEVVAFKTLPFWYSAGATGGTMVLNVLCHLLNRCHGTNYPAWIAVAGSDLIYKDGQQNHFYGAGRPDPMRLGKDLLSQQLLKIKERAEALKCTICNVGGQEETLLPFVRYSL